MFAKKRNEESMIGIAAHAHSVIDFDAHFNHCYAMQKWAQKYSMKMLGYKGLFAAQAREMLCEGAISEGCSHIFFLDADHLIPVETLDCLMESKDEAIISGLICRRSYPFDQVAYGKLDKKGSYVPIDISLDGKLYEVAVCAFGCTLMNLTKLQELDKPWFRDTCVERCNGEYMNMRSDINICDAFRAKGYKVWIDTRVLVGHIGANLIIYPQNADDLKNFRHQYVESMKLRVGQTGNYGSISRVL